MHKRRKLVIALGSAVLATSLTSIAQQQIKVHRIGLLSQFSSIESVLWHQAFGLNPHDLGWVEGKNIAIEYRYAAGKRDRLPELASELVRLKVDIIVASLAAAAFAARNATMTIPIVMAGAGDPVAPAW